MSIINMGFIRSLVETGEPAPKPPTPVELHADPESLAAYQSTGHGQFNAVPLSGHAPGAVIPKPPPVEYVADEFEPRNRKHLWPEGGLETAEPAASSPPEYTPPFLTPLSDIRAIKEGRDIARRQLEGTQEAFVFSVELAHRWMNERDAAVKARNAAELDRQEFDQMETQCVEALRDNRRLRAQTESDRKFIEQRVEERNEVQTKLELLREQSVADCEAFTAMITEADKNITEAIAVAGRMHWLLLKNHPPYPRSRLFYDYRRTFERTFEVEE